MDYALYLERVARLSSPTRQSRQNSLRRFLYRLFPSSQFDSSAISVSVLQNFLTTEMMHVKPSSRKTFIGVIRSYCRYLRFKGVEVDKGLLILPLSAPVWKVASVPKTLTSNEINLICSAFDLCTPTGKRDYAIFLCFTELGLRSSEVANLSLSDFNWRDASVLIKKTKSHVQRALPLSQPLGEAIVQYLELARPTTCERVLFVRFSHRTGEPMGTSQIRGSVRRAYARAGISPSITGTHILRHTKAGAMYDGGANLKVIADVLGHASIDTAVIYTKVGRSHLLWLICPWPEAQS